MSTGPALITAIAAMSLAGSARAQDFDAATGYRVAHYRGTISAAPPGVARITAAQVARLVDRDRAILIDVVPAEGGVRDAAGNWRLAREERGIPGAHWFPEAGRGAIDPAIERWFLLGVSSLARRHPHARVIVFCLADCWMSWNAALRLHRAGVAHVRWFAEGADGWRDLGRSLTAMTPYKDSR